MEGTVSEECSRTGQRSVCVWTTKRVIERKESEWARVFCYTRLPGQDTTVSVTLFFCSLSMGMREELFMPTVVAPFTATISSPHLERTTKTINVKSGESRATTGYRSWFRHMGVKSGLTYLRRPSKWAGVPGTMVLMKKGCWPWLSS